MSTELATIEQKHIEAWTPSFAISVDAAIERKSERQRFFKEVLDEGFHYGKIPGAGDKPTLLKPGAEMLLANMGLNVELADELPPILDYDGTGPGNGEPLIVYRRVCRIYRQIGPGETERMKVAQASGSCNSREKKYRYRTAQRICPQCGIAAIFASKKDEGFFCWKKKDGCGATFAADDPAITEQEVGQIPNPDIVDVENTILKMADKRALVAATLLATGCSDIFTQDVEDSEPGGTKAAAQPKPQAQPTQRPAERERVTFTARAALNALTAWEHWKPGEVQAMFRAATNNQLAFGAEVEYRDDYEAIYTVLRKAQIKREAELVEDEKQKAGAQTLIEPDGSEVEDEIPF